MNLWLDLAWLRSDMPHINIIDSSYIPREEYMDHGFHLNARGKEMLVCVSFLTALGVMRGV